MCGHIVCFIKCVSACVCVLYRNQCHTTHMGCCSAASKELEHVSFEGREQAVVAE